MCTGLSWRTSWDKIIGHSTECYFFPSVFSQNSFQINNFKNKDLIVFQINFLEPLSHYTLKIWKTCPLVFTIVKRGSYVIPFSIEYKNSEWRYWVGRIGSAALILFYRMFWLLCFIYIFLWSSLLAGVLS